jgi:hypothetical protein
VRMADEHVMRHRQHCFHVVGCMVAAGQCGGSAMSHLRQRTPGGMPHLCKRRRHSLISGSLGVMLGAGASMSLQYRRSQLRLDDQRARRQRSSSAQRGFVQPLVGIRSSMGKANRLRHARQRTVKIQRRVWVAQALIWPTLIAAGVLFVGGLVWFLRRRSAGGQHEMPDTPGAHEAGTMHVEP